MSMGSAYEVSREREMVSRGGELRETVDANDTSSSVVKKSSISSRGRTSLPLRDGAGGRTRYWDLGWGAKRAMPDEDVE